MELRNQIERIIKTAAANSFTETKKVLMWPGLTKAGCAGHFGTLLVAAEINQLAFGKCATGPCSFRSR